MLELKLCIVLSLILWQVQSSSDHNNKIPSVDYTIIGNIHSIDRNTSKTCLSEVTLDYGLCYPDDGTCPGPTTKSEDSQCGLSNDLVCCTNLKSCVLEKNLSPGKCIPEAFCDNISGIHSNSNTCYTTDVKLVCCDVYVSSLEQQLEYKIENKDFKMPSQKCTVDSPPTNSTGYCAQPLACQASDGQSSRCEDGSSKCLCKDTEECCFLPICHELPPLSQSMTFSNVFNMYSNTLFGLTGSKGASFDLMCPYGEVFVVSGSQRVKMVCKDSQFWSVEGSNHKPTTEDLTCITDLCQRNACPRDFECNVTKVDGRLKMSCVCPVGYKNGPTGQECIDCSSQKHHELCQCTNEDCSDEDIEFHNECGDGDNSQNCEKCPNKNKPLNCPCTINEDCDTSLVCSETDKLCVKNCFNPPFSTGCSCQEETDCGVNNYCDKIDYICRDCGVDTGPGCKCSKNSDCCKKTGDCACVNKSCKVCGITNLPVGCGCSSNSQCEANSICVVSKDYMQVCQKCPEKPLPEGCTCTSNKDCIGHLICYDGVCNYPLSGFTHPAITYDEDKDMIAKEEDTCRKPCKAPAYCKNNQCICPSIYYDVFKDGTYCIFKDMFGFEEKHPRNTCQCPPPATCTAGKCRCPAGHDDVFNDGHFCFDCRLCSPHADCLNGYCACRLGFRGDGYYCVKNEVCTCPDQFLPFMNACYLFGMAPTSYMGAINFCHAQGASLIEISNENEDKTFSQLMQEMGYPTIWIKKTNILMSSNSFSNFVDNDMKRLLKDNNYCVVKSSKLEHQWKTFPCKGNREAVAFCSQNCISSLPVSTDDIRYIFGLPSYNMPKPTPEAKLPLIHDTSNLRQFPVLPVVIQATPVPFSAPKHNNLDYEFDSYSGTGTNAIEFREKPEIIYKKKKEVCNCPANFMSIGEGCIHLESVESESWMDARNTCERMNSSLAIIHSEDDDIAIRQFLGDKGVNSVWLGASKRAQSNEWMWLDGTQLISSETTYLNFKNMRPQDNTMDVCLLMSQMSNYQWVEAECDVYRMGKALCFSSCQKGSASLGILEKCGPFKCFPPAVCDNGVCKCPGGYKTIPTSSLGTTSCKDIDECILQNPCGSHGKCKNVEGSYFCECKPGSVWNGKTCTDVDECRSFPCHRYALCKNTMFSYHCKCMLGFTGDGHHCADINECSDQRIACDGNSVTCVNTHGSFKCICKPGYTGDGTVCKDINECDKHPCHENGICTNMPGSYKCQCKPYFTGDGYNCTSVKNYSPPPIAKKLFQQGPSGNYYALITKPRTLSSALKYCRDILRSRLAWIEDPWSNEFLKVKLEKEGFDRAYIGLIFKPASKRDEDGGNWVWVRHDKSTSKLKKDSYSQLHATAVAHKKAEHLCSFISSTSDNWHPTKCGAQLVFICEHVSLYEGLEKSQSVDNKSIKSKASMTPKASDGDKGSNFKKATAQASHEVSSQSPPVIVSNPMNFINLGYPSLTVGQLSQEGYKETKVMKEQIAEEDYIVSDTIERPETSDKNSRGNYFKETEDYSPKGKSIWSYPYNQPAEKPRSIYQREDSSSSDIMEEDLARSSAASETDRSESLNSKIANESDSNHQPHNYWFNISSVMITDYENRPNVNMDEEASRLDWTLGNVEDILDEEPSYLELDEDDYYGDLLDDEPYRFEETSSDSPDWEVSYEKMLVV